MNCFGSSRRADSPQSVRGTTAHRNSRGNAAPRYRNSIKISARSFLAQRVSVASPLRPRSFLLSADSRLRRRRAGPPNLFLNGRKSLFGLATLCGHLIYCGALAAIRRGALFGPAPTNFNEAAAYGLTACLARLASGHRHSASVIWLLYFALMKLPGLPPRFPLSRCAPCRVSDGTLRINVLLKEAPHVAYSSSRKHAPSVGSKRRSTADF